MNASDFLWLSLMYKRGRMTHELNEARIDITFVSDPHLHIEKIHKNQFHFLYFQFDNICFDNLSQ